MARGLSSYLAALVFIAIGAGIIALGIWLGVRVEKRKGWPTVEAVVVSSGWTESADDRRFGVAFEFQVDGGDYRGAVDIDPYDAPHNGPEAYQPGARVPVYYDPEDPGRSVLYPGDHWMNAYAVALGAVIVVFGTLPFVQLALRLYAKRQLAVAKAHLKQFAERMEEANAGLEAVRDKTGSEYRAGAQRKGDLLAEAEEAVEMYRELEEELDDWGDGPEAT